MRRVMHTDSGAEVTISDAEFEKRRAQIMKPGGGKPADGERQSRAAKPAVAANPLVQARYTGIHGGGRVLAAGDSGPGGRIAPGDGKRGAETVDDRRRRAASIKAGLAPLLKEADAMIEMERMHEIEKSTQKGRAAIARRLKEKYN